jgi:hypothetical protein
MKRDDHVDYFLVPDGQLAIHEKLEQWARWVKPRAHGWHVQPMFRQYRSHAWQWERPEVRAAINMPEAVDMERLVAGLPEKNREAIRWAYVWRGNPVGMARRLAVNKQGLLDLIHAGRVMLTNRSGP